MQVGSLLRIATRGSKLALWQARYVRDLLIAADPDLRVELVTIVSTGDAVRDRPLFEVGGVGVFTKEVQDAVLDGRADLAVHSLKDLPTQSHAELVLAAVPRRGSPFDVLVAPKFRTLEQLPPGATVATSSLRRRAQLLRHRPDLAIVDIRGNVETRIRKIEVERLAGVVLAEAGLARLGMEDQITQKFAPELLLPAVGQGALGIECRQADAQTRAILASLEDTPTRQAVEAERAFMRLLQGGCQVPIGGHAVVDSEHLHLTGIVLNRAGSQSYGGSIAGPANQAEQLGNQLADQLIEQGAAELLKDE